jgi:hypothetical protein
MRVIYVKNFDTESHTWGSQLFTASQAVQIQDEAEAKEYIDDTSFFTAIGTADMAKISKDGTNYNLTAAEAWAWLLGNVIEADIGVDKCSSENALKVATTKLEGSSVLLVSHDWCDRTTWWTDSVRVENQTLSTTDDTVFTSATSKVNWINLVSGKVAYEDNVADDYRTLVYVDDELVTTGFTIDYALGKITFSEAQTGKVVKATYSYENGSTWKITPDSGKILKMLGTTVKYSENVVLGANQTFTFQLYAGDNPAMPATVYKNMKNFIECAVGDVRHVPSHGGMAQDVIELDFDYMTSKDIAASPYALNIRVKVSDDEPITGEWACVQAKCLSLDS